MSPWLAVVYCLVFCVYALVNRYTRTEPMAGPGILQSLRLLKPKSNQRASSKQIKHVIVSLLPSAYDSNKFDQF